MPSYALRKLLWKYTRYEFDNPVRGKWGSPLSSRTTDPNILSFFNSLSLSLSLSLSIHVCVHNYSDLFGFSHKFY